MNYFSLEQQPCWRRWNIYIYITLGSFSCNHSSGMSPWVEMLTICWANKAGGISIELVTLTGSLYVHICIILLSFQVTQLLVNVTDVSKKANVSKFYSQQDVPIDQVWTIYLPSIDFRIESDAYILNWNPLSVFAVAMIHLVTSSTRWYQGQMCAKKSSIPMVSV